MSATDNTPQPFADAAAALLEAGWSPLPLPPRAKANPPTGYTGEHGRRADRRTVDRWLKHGVDLGGGRHAPAGNVAVRAPDGIVGVDVDQYGDKRGADLLNELLDELGIALPTTWISTARPAPSGIRWLRIPTGTRLRGAPLAGVEIVQVHHRYAVAPPSIHPDTGNPYRWIGPGGELADLPPSPDELPAMPAELIEAWRDDAVPAPRRAALPPTPPPTDRDRSRAVDDVLDSRRGWAPGGRHDEACRVSMALARLEHSGHPGATAALELVGADFTSAVDGERDGGREWSSIVDSARRKAATTESQRPDYRDLIGNRPAPTSTRSDGDDLSDLDLDADHIAAVDDDEPPTWGDVTPLIRTPVAAFPLDTLPAWIVTEARAVADELAVPVDMPAVAALGALSTIAAGRLDVQPGARYRTSTNLYVCIVAESGAGKSPAMQRMVTGPCRKLERKLVDLTRSTVAESAARHERLEAAVEKASKSLRNDPTDAGERDLAKARAELLEHEPTAQPVVVLDDVTPEKLAIALAEQQGRSSIVTPEGGSLFESIAGLRYKSGGAAQTTDVPKVYLSGYSREPLRTDRVNRSAVVVENPTLTVVASVQPVVVERLAATPDVARQGALARFLWAWPADRIGYRPSGRYRHAPDDDGTYSDRLVELGLRARRYQTPLVLDVTADACDQLDAWTDDLERQLRPGGDLRPHRAAVSKLQTAPWRLAGLLAFADDGAEQRLVDGDLMRRALDLCDYFLANAVAAERVAGVTVDGNNLTQQVASHIADRAGDELDVRADLYLPMRSQLDDGIAGLVAPLLELEQLGWLRIEGEIDNIGHQRRANPVVVVHPQLSRVALHPVIEATDTEPITRVTRDVPAADSAEQPITRVTRELEPADDPDNARNGRSRVKAFRESSSSVDTTEDTHHARPRVTRVNEPPADPLFSANNSADIDHDLGADPFGPAHTPDNDNTPLW